MAQSESTTFDSSAIDPETYFQQALMGMNMIEDSFALSSCNALCKCSFCCSMNKSACSITSSSTFTADCSTNSDDDEVRSTTSSDLDELFVRKFGYEEGEPACIVLPMSDDYSSSRSLSGYSKKNSPSNGQLDEQQIKDLEGRVKNAQFRDRDLQRRKMQLQVERDNLRSLLQEIEAQDALRKVRSAKLERIYEHDEE